MKEINSPLRILLACYGGGHSQIVSTVAQALIERGHDVEVIGFTTAFGALKRSGLRPKNVTTLVDRAADAKYAEMVRPFLPEDQHPEISQEETHAYFTLGFRDLCLELGEESALEKLERLGRKSFEPVDTMRRYLAKKTPDVVMATTSPRFELALLKAARSLDIPSIAIGDLFLLKERDWILQDNYAEHLCVFSQNIAQSLTADGLVNTEIHVTGNPAFDSLEQKNDKNERRTALRKQYGVEDKKLVLWPAAGGEISLTGVRFTSPEEAVNCLESVCSADPSFAYAVRPHPNKLFSLPDGAANGFLTPPDLSADDSLLIADIVCVEASTMGLQAALLGLPVICLRFSDYVVYPNFGLATSVNTLEQLANSLINNSYNLPAELDMPKLGTATQNVVELIEQISDSKR